MLLLALACTKLLDRDPGDDSSSDSADSGELRHPNVPDDKWGIWQHEGCNDGADTIVYIVAEGNTDADGNLLLEEKWYWFFDDTSWDLDCIDTLEYAGERVSQSYHQTFEATESEEGYAGEVEKTDDQCPHMNYLATFKHPDEDDFEYGDTMKMDFVTFYDTLTPSGNPNLENAMLVYMYFGKSPSFTWGASDYGRGTITPEDESEHGPPANYVYETSMCFDG
ncbi:MAG TPA: hypothetical protein QGF58_26040 [Myxococcota bacterium]|nr:hypothetical protein [Myxococcota bacterium]